MIKSMKDHIRPAMKTISSELLDNGKPGFIKRYQMSGNGRK